MEIKRKPLLQILFFNGYEYYFEYDTQYKLFKLSGLNKKNIKYKAGTLCLKILSNINDIIHSVDNCQEKIYKNDNNFDTIRDILYDFANEIEIFDKIFSKITLNELLNEIGDRNFKIKETEKELKLIKKFLKDYNNDPIDLSDYKSTQRELNDLKKVKDDDFVVSILDDYIYSVNDARLFIDYYFNFIKNDEIRNNLKYKSPKIRAYSIHALRDLTLSLPESEKILSIIDNDNLLPATSYLYNKSTDSNLSRKKRIAQILDLLYKGNITNDVVYYVEVYNIYSISDLLNASINYFIQNNITVCMCKNCGKYFIPTNKNNETLCDNIYKNRKNMQRTFL